MTKSGISVRLVSHASVIIETRDCRIWTDPWLFGRAFNDSWALLGPVAWDESWLDGIDYLWVSHEHPDHFHLQTLRSLPETFRERVTVLFQQNNSQKMFEAFAKLGFPNHRALPHRETLVLTGATSAYNYQAMPMDSALAVIACGQCVLNLNDAEVNSRDCQTIAKDLGQVDVVLNQFSIAGYAGLVDRDRHLPELADRVIENVSANHGDLNAGITIPIASFIYFCREDNRYMNAYANTPRRVVEVLQTRGQDVAVLFPGDEMEIGKPVDTPSAVTRWGEVYAGLDALEYEAPWDCTSEAIIAAFHQCAASLAEHYPRWLLRRLEPVTVRVPDLDRTFRFALATDTIEEVSEEAEIEVHSQPLQLVFAQPFGMQTLGVSARLVVHRSSRNWRFHRILFSMLNAEVYLRPRHLFNASNARFLRTHLSGGVNQIRYRLSLMR